MSEVEIVGHMTSEAAARAFIDAHAQGRRKMAPDPVRVEAILQKGEWVLAWIPLRWLDYQRGEDAGLERVQRALIYSQSAKRLPSKRKRLKFPPIVVSYGPTLRRKDTKLAFVSDGNHRALAAEVAGANDVLSMIPLSDLQALIKSRKSP